MEKITQAGAMFDQGFVCSQAILAAFAADLGMDRTTALKLASGFGGGMAATGQTCGAVTGAIMVIGLAKGNITVEDETSKNRTYAAVTKFIRRFEKIHGSVNCTELLGHDLRDPDAYKRAKESGLFKTLCPQFVKSAARLLREVLPKDNRV